MGINFHFYADDTQVFDIAEVEAAVAKMEEAVQVMKENGFEKTFYVSTMTRQKF